MVQDFFPALFLVKWATAAHSLRVAPDTLLTLLDGELSAVFVGSVAVHVNGVLRAVGHPIYYVSLFALTGRRGRTRSKPVAVTLLGTN